MQAARRSAALSAIAGATVHDEPGWFSDPRTAPTVGRDLRRVMGMTGSHAHVADALMVVLGKQSVRRASSQNRRRKSYVFQLEKLCES